MNIVARIAERAAPDHSAIITADRKIPFHELLAGAAEISRWLETQPGFPGKGGRIGLDCANGAEYIMLALGILASGACLVPIAPELTAAERGDLSARTFLHGVLSADATGKTWAHAAPENFPHEEEFRALGPAFIRFSSGTTGVSKGVVLSHRALEERVAAANRGLRIGPEDRVLWLLPMAHHFAVSIVLYLYHGAATVLVDSHLAADVLETVRRERPTVVYASPFHHALLAADASRQPWPDLRLAISTAAALPSETARNFSRRFGKPLVQGLGVIEAGLPILNIIDAQEHPTALGRPLPDFEARVAHDGLSVRGPGMFDAYLSPWTPRGTACPDGWFPTGDLAEIDETGLIFLRGRLKTVINVNGMKVFPEEVESVLNEHPDVRASLVSGKPHPVFGMILTAEIIPEHPAENFPTAELARWCRKKLSSYKIPAHFRATATLPLTPSGKIRRFRDAE